MRHLFFKIICLGCERAFNVPIYCGSRFCPVCSIRRNLRVRKRLNHLVENCEHPRGYSFKHLTLTISNQKNLKGMATEIVASFRKLRNRQYWKNNVDGGAYVVEITGFPGNWHVHLHIVMMSRFLDFNRLLKLWMKVSSGRGVYIQQISASIAVKYLTKYLSKPTEPDETTPELIPTPADVQDEMNWELHDKRLFNPFGTWHKLSREYEKPKCLCKKCSNGKFMPFDLIYGKPPQAFFVDT